MVTMVTGGLEKSRVDRAELVTIATVDEAKPAENKGFMGAEAPKIVYLLIPSCGSRVNLRA